MSGRPLVQGCRAGAPFEAGRVCDGDRIQQVLCLTGP
jgi:hypothetical protein